MVCAVAKPLQVDAKVSQNDTFHVIMCGIYES